MSLYNLLYGVNPLKDVLLKVLDIDQPDGKWQSGRFRDIFLEDDGTKIVLFTRNGGGNRVCWKEVDGRGKCDENNVEELCPGCVITKHLPKHPNYITDYDDSYDSTYAFIEFSVPEKYKEFCKKLASLTLEKAVEMIKNGTIWNLMESEEKA